MLYSYTNHSGGARGSDAAWDIIGQTYGVKSIHYYAEGYKTPLGNLALNVDQLSEADVYLHKANEVLKRRFPTNNQYVDGLLRRNWHQVKNAEAVFAISTIKNNIVQGGTGWAVHMAISVNKEVFVFDQDMDDWFTYRRDAFRRCNTPILTKNFAGIGTREIKDNGKV